MEGRKNGAGGQRGRKHLLRLLRREAGSGPPDRDLLDVALDINAKWRCCTIGEVAEAVHMVEWEREGWVERGWHSPDRLALLAEKGRRGGKASGKARAGQRDERRKRVRELDRQGWSREAIMAEVGISRRTFFNYLK